MLNLSREIKIKKLMLEKNISQKELANITKIDYVYLNKIIKNKYEPNVKYAIRIAKALNTTVEKIFD